MIKKNVSLYTYKGIIYYSKNVNFNLKMLNFILLHSINSPLKKILYPKMREKNEYMHYFKINSKT